MAIEIQIRRDTAANWTSVDPILAQGELGLETDTNQLKIGDGILAWTALAYFGSSGNPFDQDLNTTDAVVFAGLTNNAIIYPTVDGTAGQVVVTDGSGNLSFASPSVGVSSITAGTGISVDVATGDVTVTNSAPDQIVSLTDGTGISVTGTYPDFTIATTITQYTDSDARLSLSAGTGISYDNATGIITNSEPDQTVSLTGGTDISVTGTYPDFTIDFDGNTSYLPLSGGTMTGSITSFGTTHDTEVSGDFFGVQLSADHTQGTMVNFDGLDTYDGASHMKVTPTGLTFPDKTTQTTAYTGGAGVSSITAGTGINVDTTTGAVTVTNSEPDQTVSLTDGTGISVTGTYPDFTITNSSPDQTVTLTDGTDISVTGTYPDFTISYTGSGGGSGTVTSVDMSVPTGLLVSGNPVTTSGTLAVTFDTGYSIPTTSSQGNWDTAYSNYLQWDGGSTGLTASTGRTSLGATAVGVSMFTLTDPSAITFPRFNADNTVTALTDADFRTAIGSGTVTSIGTTSPITGGTITGTGTIGINASSENTASFVVQRDASGNFSAGTITASLTGNATGLAASAALTTPTITGLIEKQTAPAISAGVLALNCASGNVFAVSLNAAITSITFSNIPTSGNAFGLTLAFTADGTSRTISWPASVKWPSGTAPTLTSTNAKVDIFVLTTWNAGTTWYAMIGGQNL